MKPREWVTATYAICMGETKDLRKNERALQKATYERNI
jgi:hypothetical protein